MTSSTWSFSASAELIGCGVDCETVERFEALGRNGSFPMPFVFTPKEMAHALGSGERATMLCLCFTCKEALLKAAGIPYDFTACEVLPVFDDSNAVFEGELTLDPALKADLGVSRALVRSTLTPAPPKEVISAVYLFSEVDA
jgi:phosphopantetheinyl transferase (holo-ACP synthase)